MSDAPTASTPRPPARVATPALPEGADGVALPEAYRAVRRATEALCEPLATEDYVVQSMPDASPVKWHLAHTTWFFETFLLQPSRAGYRTFDPAYNYLFNSYYNAIGDRHPRPERGMLSRPALAEVIAYRAHVDRAMLELLGTSLGDDMAARVELGLHHEQQHQELILTDVKHLLSRNPLKPAYQKPWPLTPILPMRRGWISYPAGLREIGHGG